MTTKTLSTYVDGGYVLAPQYDGLIITKGAGVMGGGGLQINHAASVNNAGYVAGDVEAGGNGVSATAAMNLDNDVRGHILGYSGVFTQHAAATVVNDGYIEGLARYGNGVFLTAGGQVINARSNAYAYIYGKNTGVTMSGVASVTNYGRIGGIFSSGVHLIQGGWIDNANSYAQIYSQEDVGVRVDGLAGTIFNSGEIDGPRDGVYLASAGLVHNFASGRIDAGANQNAAGVSTHGGPATVQNYGEISSGCDGVDLDAGGTVVNGGTILDSAGYFGVLVTGASGTVFNGAVGIFGSGNYTSLIQGAVYLNAGGVVGNYATIEGNGATGVYVKSGTIVNGYAKDPQALIDGYYVGVRTGAKVTLTNFGVIESHGGFAPKAVEFGAASDTLIVEAGCAFIGQVQGAGGTLQLASGTGKLSLLAGDTETVSGSMAATTFSSFATVEVAAGATFATTGAVTIAAGQSIVSSGALTLGQKKHVVANAGLIEVLAGTLTVAGKVTGAGTAAIGGGLLDFERAFDQNVAFTGAAGTLELAASQAYGGTISGFATSGGTALDLGDIAFGKHTSASYSGSKKSGVLTVTDGTHTAHVALSGDYRSTSFVASSDGDGGVLITANPGVEARPHAFVTAMASLAGPPATAQAAVWRDHAPPMLLAPRAAIA